MFLNLLKLSCLIVLLKCGSIIAQNNKIQLEPLRCKGQIPEDFTKAFKSKFNEKKIEIAQSDASRKEKKTNTNNTLNSLYASEKILLSGKVLYGDVLSQYVNLVAEKALSGNKSLQKSIRIYVIKSETVETYSTDDGILFITVGLLSQMESEAQLAFLICHEAMHIDKKHKKEYTTSGEGESYKLDDILNFWHNYSKDDELEADKLAFELYSKSGYAKEEAKSAIELLKYGYLPYDEIDWKKEVLQDSFFKLPASYTPKIKKEEDEEKASDDEETNEKLLDSRYNALESLVSKSDDEDGTLFLNSTEAFKIAQQQARIELFHILLTDANYSRAYYLSFLYNNIYKDSVFSSKIAAYAFYGASKNPTYTFDWEAFFKNNKSLYNFDFGDLMSIKDATNEIKIEGAITYVDYVFSKLDKNDVSILSVRHAWKAYQSDTNDITSKNLFENSLIHLFQNTTYTFSSFVKLSDSIKKMDTVNIAKLSNSNLSKVEKLKLLKKKQVSEVKEETEVSASNHNRFGFYFLLEDKKFSRYLSDFSAKYKFTSSDKKDEFDYTNYKKRRKFRRKYGQNAGIDSLTLISPQVILSSSKRDVMTYDLLGNVSEGKEIAQKYQEYAAANDVTLNYLDINNTEDLTTEKLNEYSIMMDWLLERINNPSANVELYNHRFIKSKLDKGENYLGISSLSYFVLKSDAEFKYILGFIIYPLAPYALEYYLHREHHLQFTTVIYDLRTGNPKFLDVSKGRARYKKDYLNAQIYALFNQIKTKPYEQ